MKKDIKAKIKRIGITGRYTNKLSKKVANKTIKILEKLGVKYSVAREFRLKKKSVTLAKLDADIVLAFGGDGTLLHTCREGKAGIPVAGVNCGTIGHLTEVNADRIESFVEGICDGNYSLEHRTRLVGKSQRKVLPQALNEIAIAPIKSNMIMRYKVYVNGKLTISDLADGLIVATPTGSTAHALSAGGPELMPNVGALVIVPVNSMDKNKRPTVVKEGSEIVVSDLVSKAKIEAVVDGHIHSIIKEKITITKGSDAVFLRVKKPEHRNFEKIHRSLTPSARFIFEVLNHHGMLTKKEITKETQLPLRTISRSLKQLLLKGLISEKQFLTNEKVRGYLIR